MKYIIFLIPFLYSNFIFAQNKINCNKIEERYLSSSARYKDKTLTKENVKLCLENGQKKIKIEIINYGDFNQFEQSFYIKFIKINNGYLEPVLNLSKLQNINIQENFSSKNKWNGGVSNMLGIYYKDFSNYIKINQEYYSKKEEGYNIPLENIETYETLAPINGFSFKIITFKKEAYNKEQFEMTKTINIYFDNTLVKTLNYTHQNLFETGGIGVELLNISEIEP